jgi:outer membrane protein assembly factor BamB
MRWMGCALLVGALLGCGGGGGGDGGEPPTHMSLSAHRLDLTANTTDGPPNAAVVITLDHAPSAGVYAGYASSDSAVASVQITGNTATTATVLIAFKSPSALGPGTYDDTIGIVVCYDSECANPVGDSPQTITTQLVVTQSASPTTISISGLSPSSTPAQGAAFTLTINGTGFVPSSAIGWNGTLRTTTYVSPTQLTAAITAADIENIGVDVVTVTNLAIGGGSANATFNVVAPAGLSLARVSPTSVPSGSPAFVITVLGTGFDAGSIIEWNGSPLATTYVSHTELTAKVPAANVASVGQASIIVNSPGGPTAISTALVVQIKAPSIDAVSYQIDSGHSGYVSFNQISLPSAIKWAVNLDGPVSYPLIVAGKVFVTVSLASTSELLALDQATGNIVWEPLPLLGSANATYDSGTVFVLSAVIGSPGTLQAFDAATGHVRWTTSLTSQYAFESPPTAAQGMVFVAGAGNGGTLYGIDGATGSVMWAQPVSNGSNGAPVATADAVYVTYPCTTQAFRLLTGEPLWSDNTGCSGGGGDTSVAANGVLYAANTEGASAQGDVFEAEGGARLGTFSSMVVPAIGPTRGYFLQSQVLRAMASGSNTALWSFGGDGQLITSPLVVDRYVFIGSATGNLYALDAATGAQAWSHDMGIALSEGASWGTAMPFTGLAAGDGLLVVPAGSTLTAFTLSNAP